MPFTAEQRKLADSYLRGYRTNQKLLRLARYEEEYFGGKDIAFGEGEMPSEAPLARAKMYEIRHFILSLENSDEKLLLYYHYVKGESVERCGELLGVCARTAFRLKSKALDIAFEKASVNGIIQEKSM